MNTTQTETLAELIERLRSLSIDHGPKGWPAVRTRDVTALLDRIAELEAIGTTNAALHWIAFADQSPPKSAAEDDPSVQTEDCVLVTNNIYALDRMGRMSHVWWAFPGYDERNNEWYAYTDGRKIQAPTHWCDPMAVLRASHGQAPPQPAPTWDALHYAWRKIGCDVAGLDWGVFTNAAHYAPTPTAQAAESVLEGKP